MIMIDGRIRVEGIALANIDFTDENVTSPFCFAYPGASLTHQIRLRTESYAR